MQEKNYTEENIKYGTPLHPLLRLKVMSDKEWELFIEEWLDSLSNYYVKVDRLGGSGDQGRDIVAYLNSIEWHNYQCKHYDHPLRPNDIWLEIGKLVYYSFISEYTLPSKYFFVAPQGIGTFLYKLFEQPEKLKELLLANWDKKCSRDITKTAHIKLTEDLTSYIKSLDFGIFNYVKPLEIIEQHAKTQYHAVRFGGGLPNRPTPQTPPVNISNEEIIYTKKLVEAYSDHKKETFMSMNDIDDIDLKEHFNDSRVEFYSVESLKIYARETLPDGEYDKLKKQIHHGIKDEIRAMHIDGYYKVCSVTKTAKMLQITDSTLLPVLNIIDRAGLCHQLANELDSITWVKK